MYGNLLKKFQSLKHSIFTWFGSKNYERFSKTFYVVLALSKVHYTVQVFSLHCEITHIFNSLLYFLFTKFTWRWSRTKPWRLSSRPIRTRPPPRCSQRWWWSRSSLPCRRRGGSGGERIFGSLLFWPFPVEGLDCNDMRSFVYVEWKREKFWLSCWYTVPYSKRQSNQCVCILILKETQRQRGISFFFYFGQKVNYARVYSNGDKGSILCFYEKSCPDVCSITQKRRKWVKTVRVLGLSIWETTSFAPYKKNHLYLRTWNSNLFPHIFS